MTEPDTTTGRVASTEPPGSYGARLAWARQRAGLTVTDIAARLRLHPNQVRAIEQENLAALPELAYVRGFVRSYARVVQVDAEPLLADLNSRLTATGSSVVDGMATESDYSPVRAAAREQTSKRLVIGLAIVALILLGAIGWYANERAQTPVPATPAASAEPAEPAAIPPSASAEQPVAAAPDPVSEAEELALVPVSMAASEAVAPPPPPLLLRLRFTGSSWLHVVDGKGKTLMSGVQQAGSEHDLDGALPLAVTIGDAGKAAVEVRGERLDLTSVTRSNVARFKVE